MFYSVSIFKMAGSSIQSNIATIILGVVNIAATAVSNAVIDRVGRKVLLYISQGGMIVSLTVFGAYFYARTEGDQDNPEG
jgi:facilitated trehalose transporter